MKNSRKLVICKKFCVYFFQLLSLVIVKGIMPKQLKPKIFKVTRKNINDDKNNFVIRWKNLSKEEIKQLRIELDDVVAHYFVKQEAPSEY